MKIQQCFLELRLKMAGMFFETHCIYTDCANMNFLRVEALESYRLTDIGLYRRTDKQTGPKLYTTPLHGWSMKITY